MCVIKPCHFMSLFRQSKGFEKVLSKVNILMMENGRGLAELKIEEEHLNQMGTLHGGFSALLVDSISSYSLTTHESPGNAHVSVNMHLSYCKDATVGEEIQIFAETLKVDKCLAFLEVIIKNKNTGDILVKGLHTKYILNQR